MNCKSAEARFVSLIHGDLSDSVVIEVRRHLETCSDCQQKYDDLTELLNAISANDPFPGVDDSYWQSFDERLDNRLDMEKKRIEEPVGNRKNSHFWRPLAGIAAAAIIVIGLFFGTRLIMDKRGKPIADDGNKSGFIPATLADRTEKFFGDAQKLLINVLHTDTEDSLIDISLEREYAVKLIRESRSLQATLPASEKYELAELVDNLETILMQIAHLEEKEDAPEVEIIQEGIRKNSILMKINLQQLSKELEKNKKKNKSIKEST